MCLYVTARVPPGFEAAENGSAPQISPLQCIVLGMALAEGVLLGRVLRTAVLIL